MIPTNLIYKYKNEKFNRKKEIFFDRNIIFRSGEIQIIGIPEYKLQKYQNTNYRTTSYWNTEIPIKIYRNTYSRNTEIKILHTGDKASLDQCG